MSDKATEIQERRRYVRLNASVELFYSILEFSPESFEKTITKDISAGGICLIADSALNPGTVLSLSVYLPDGNTYIRTSARVAWMKPFQISGESEHYDVGVEFLDLNDADRRRFDRYVFSLK